MYLQNVDITLHHNTYEDLSFAVDGPRVSNCLSASIHDLLLLITLFPNRLKTHL